VPAPLGAFYDISDLTAFADYRLPQLLRTVRVFVYSEELAQAVDSLRELPAGSAFEVEIRAATVVAVEQLKARLSASAIEIDHKLWHEGERLIAKMKPHHRVRTIFY
jgi:hypothetical protein